MVKTTTSSFSGQQWLVHAAALAILVSMVPMLGAQSFQGGIRGRILDSTGALIPAAQVTIQDEASGVATESMTNGAGEYVFAAVNPATYTLSTSADGFSRYERTGIIVSTQQFLTLDVELKVGELTETIQVTDEFPLMETTDASTGQVIDRQKLVDLPNLGRNPFLLSKLSQNVMPVGDPRYNRMQDQSGSSRISVAGGPTRGNNYTLDGVPITDTQSRAVIIPTIEAVEEVKVQGNTYNAEMGRTGGGVFNAYLKSGTNDFHGAAFGYIREPDWQANTFFNNRNGLEREEQPFRNYGGALGGPLTIPGVYKGKNRTFFHLAAEAYRQTSGVSREVDVPTPLEIAGDFSNSFNTRGTLQGIYDPLSTIPDGEGDFIRERFANDTLPASRISPIGAAIAQTYPAPSRETTAYGANNLALSSKLLDRADQFTSKLDHQVTDWWRASISYLHYGSTEPGANWLGTVSSNSQTLLNRWVDTTQVNSTFTLDPTTILTVRYGFNRFPNRTTQRSAGFDLTSIGFPADWVSQNQAPVFPSISMQSIRSLGSTGNSAVVYHSENFLVNVSKLVGSHNLKWGFDYRRMHVDGIEFGNQARFSFNNRFTRPTPTRGSSREGASVASLLLGFPSSGNSRQVSQLFQFADYYSGYLQDDFRVNSKLTLNLGVRYEYETGLQAKDNALLVGFDQNVANPIAVTDPSSGLSPVGGLLYAGVGGNRNQTGDANRNKISPRFGVAWRVTERTTIRTGYGLFWAPLNYGLQNTLGYDQVTPYIASIDGDATPANSLSDPYPNGLLRPVGNADGLLAGIGRDLSTVDQTHRSPYVHKYSFDLQREIGAGITLSAGYVGSTSRNLIGGSSSVDINQLDPALMSLGNQLNQTVPNPFFDSAGPGFISARTITLAQSLKRFPQFGDVRLNNVDYNRARYDSLVVKAQKRLRGGLGFLTTWTWSKRYDASSSVGSDINSDGAIQNNFDTDAEYGLSAIHSPHRWTTAFTYELPFGQGRRFATSRALDYVVGGWSINSVITLQTGFPLAVTQNTNNNSITGAGQRPTATGISPETPGSLSNRIDGYINPEAFSETEPYTFGNVGRTISMRGPGQSNWDLSLFKTFSVTEKVKAQFRAEALNFTNTPFFERPSASFGNSSFGVIDTQEGFPRLIQLGARFFF